MSSIFTYILKKKKEDLAYFSILAFTYANITSYYVIFSFLSVMCSFYLYQSLLLIRVCADETLRKNEEESAILSCVENISVEC